MPRPRTRTSRLAAVLTGMLMLLLAEHALRIGSSALGVLEGVVAVVGMLAAVKLWMHNCFESRLVVTLALVSVVAGTLLATTLGLPGAPVAPWDLSHVLLLALGATVMVLLVADARERRSSRSLSSPPYAL